MTVWRSHARKIIATVAAAALIGAGTHAAVASPSGPAETTAAGPAPESPASPAPSPAAVEAGRSTSPAARPAFVEAARKVVRSNKKAVHATAGDRYQATDVVVDKGGARHVRFGRTWDGLDVLGGDFVVHTTGAGKFAGATVAQDGPVDISRTPKVSERDAIATAGKRLNGPAKARLVVDAHKGEPALAWQVTIAKHLVVIVDATTRHVRRTYDLIKAADTATGRGLHNGDVKLSTTRTGEGSFALIDPDRGGNTTRDALNSTETPTEANSRAFTDADDVWGDGTMADRATAGADVHYGLAQAWDYFKDTFGRAGINGDGKGIPAYAHHDVNEANAAWNSYCACVMFGDGDGSRKPFTSLDIVGHEMAHGLTDRTADLVYDGESGALNEATSDIFGTLVEFAANNPADGPDYLVAEMTGPQPLRWMDEPIRNDKSVSCWSPSVKDLDVHYSSGVAGKFFYNLAVGSGSTRWGSSTPCGGAAPVTGIGNDAAGAIWYRALTTYMVSNTDFAGAHQATLRAAADLYGSDSAERSAVRAAWLASGVDGSGTVPPSNAAPVIDPIQFATAHVGTPVEYQLIGHDAQGQTIVWSATDLPAGLTITRQGLISGVPTAKTRTSVKVDATDPDGNRTSWRAAPWFVKGPPRLVEPLPSSRTFNVGAEVSFTAEFDDFPDFLLDQRRPVTVETAGLPDGLTAATMSDAIGATTVTVKGTPTTVGTGTIRFTATDLDGETVTATLPYTVAPPLAPTKPIAYVLPGDVSGTATVNWYSPAAGSPSVTDYVVRVKPDEEQVLPATARSVTLAGLDMKQTYEIGVRARGRGGDSPETTLRLQPSEVTLSPQSLITSYASPVTLTGTLIGPAVNPRAYLEQKPAASTTWAPVATVIPSSTGAWSHTVNPTVTTAYRVVHPPSIGWWPSMSATSTITVRYAVTVVPSTTSTTAGKIVTFTGTVRPATAGVLASLQRYTNGEWVTIQSAPTTAAGSYSIRRAFARGTWNLRVVASGGNTNADGFTSALELTVR